MRQGKPVVVCKARFSAVWMEALSVASTKCHSEEEDDSSESASEEEPMEEEEKRVQGGMVLLA